MNMITPMQLTIVGAKPSKFEIDDYKEDTTKVYALVPLDETSGGLGQAVQDFNYLDSNAISIFAGQEFPVNADCKVELITSGKKSRLVLRSIEFKDAKLNLPKA
ncbi:hypothetical protein ACT3N8_13725 [Psychrobacter aquimaris]|uniref:hypothetical protein n=1 Tax=Psychrobacter aquimaris TaxID=292733 RepID=UPI003FD55518